MKNKITSLILVAAIALLANLAGIGSAASSAIEANSSDSILLCYDKTELSEF